ncbi:unnamed protein product [Rotaria sordida]|uniref:Uncharacterized protein n=1 Tax=Rotaria sordida TaxID=392033 RepID=A0A819R4L3_9BILA|nr:unnamed protein product [Rotaria sordida]
MKPGISKSRTITYFVPRLHRKNKKTLNLLSTNDSTSNVHADITAIHDQFISTLLTLSISSTSSPPTLSISAISSFLIPIDTT